MTRRQALLGLLLVAVFAHLGTVWDHYVWAASRTHGGDFASYYFAAEVAQDGGNPYRPAQLRKLAAVDPERMARSKKPGFVHPYFYPPPFLMLVWWSPQTDLLAAWEIWWALSMLSTAVCLLALARWWAPLGAAVPVLLAASLVAFTVIPNNYVMGQANLPVMAFAVLGLWAADAERPWLGGALMGAACMFKMSPALFVAWWLLRWDWRAVLSACATAVVLSLASLALVGPDVQLDFYLRVLPGFADGRYNGLKMPITMYGNHSIPNLIHQAVGGSPQRLAPLASSIVSVINGALLVGLATAFWWNPPDARTRWAQVSAVSALMLLMPVYTYEHHMVWVLPAMVVTGAAVADQRLPRWVGLLWVLAATAQCWELQDLRSVSTSLRKAGWVTSAGWVRELKFLALLFFFGLSAYLGTSGWTERIRSKHA